MPTTRRRSGATRQTRPPIPPTPLESRIEQEVTSRVKRRLGLAEEDGVPTEVQALVAAAVREVAENAIANTVIREVETVADLPLLREAEYLAAKKRALQAAGFSSEDAMRILVAEVEGGASFPDEHKHRLGRRFSPI
jgi:hypothetical protein